MYMHMHMHRYMCMYMYMCCRNKPRSPVQRYDTLT